MTHDLDIVPNLEEESWKKLISSIWELDTRPRSPESKERISDVSGMGKRIRLFSDEGALGPSSRGPPVPLAVPGGSQEPPGAQGCNQ